MTYSHLTCQHPKPANLLIVNNMFNTLFADPLEQQRDRQQQQPVKVEGFVVVIYSHLSCIVLELSLLKFKDLLW